MRRSTVEWGIWIRELSSCLVLGLCYISLISFLISCRLAGVFGLDLGLRVGFSLCGRLFGFSLHVILYLAWCFSARGGFSLHIPLYSD